MAEVHRLFSTPVGFEMVDRTVDLEALRRSIAEERERDPRGVARSNMGGWHSATTMQHWGGEAARMLARRAAAVADSLTIDDRNRDAATLTWNVDMWANVSAAGAFHQAHVHLGCVWAAVAYLDDGYAGDTDPSLGGELVLTDPRMPQVRMNAPHLMLRESDGKEQLVETLIRPRTGLMVVFPAWLLHAVRPFRGTGTRTSVALNLLAS